MGVVLSPDQYEIVDVRTSRGMRRAMLFPKTILQAEFAANASLREAMAHINGHFTDPLGIRARNQSSSFVNSGSTLASGDQRLCFPTFQPPRARYFSATSIGSSSKGVAIVSFQRLRNPNSEITPTISTIC